MNTSNRGKNRPSEICKPVGIAKASKMHLMNNPDFFGRNGISFELATKMQLRPVKNKEGFFVGFERGGNPFEIKVTSIERWKAEVAKNRAWQLESDRIIINYLKGQKVKEN